MLFIDFSFYSLFNNVTSKISNKNYKNGEIYLNKFLWNSLFHIRFKITGKFIWFYFTIFIIQYKYIQYKYSECCIKILHFLLLFFYFCIRLIYILFFISVICFRNIFSFWFVYFLLFYFLFFVYFLCWEYFSFLFSIIIAGSYQQSQLEGSFNYKNRMNHFIKWSTSILHYLKFVFISNCYRENK